MQLWSLLCLKEEPVELLKYCNVGLTDLCCSFPVSKAATTGVLFAITVIPIAAAATDRVLRMRKRLALRVLPRCARILDVVVHASMSKK
jgi:hypothetical protein